MLYPFTQTGATSTIGDIQQCPLTVTLPVPEQNINNIKQDRGGGGNWRFRHFEDVNIFIKPYKTGKKLMK
jgi:hypothetical protein